MSGSEALNETIRLQGVVLRSERDLDDAERHLRIARWRVRRIRARLAAERTAAEDATRNARVVLGMSSHRSEFAT